MDQFCTFHVTCKTSLFFLLVCVRYLRTRLYIIHSEQHLRIKCVIPKKMHQYSIWQYVALVAQLLELDKRYVTSRNVQYFIYACPYILHFNKYNYNIVTYQWEAFLQIMLQLIFKIRTLTLFVDKTTMINMKQLIVSIQELIITVE